MSIGRRNVLGGAVIATIAPTSAITAVARIPNSPRRVSQSELSVAIERHSLWLDGKPEGKRAVFSDCDLSRLDFNSRNSASVDLSGSDFTAANLTRITGGEINFHRASLQHCDLSGSELRSPVFSGATLRKAICVGVDWGWPSSGCADPCGVGQHNMASFMNTYLGYTNFGKARVRGFFWGSTFHDASLDGADFSWSYFGGKRHLVETSFGGASLRHAVFRNTKIDAARFERAHLSATDFSFADVDPTVDLLARRDRSFIFNDLPSAN